MTYAVKSQVTVFTQLDNLLSQQHIGPIGYPALPFTVRAGLKMRIGGAIALRRDLVGRFASIGSRARLTKCHDETLFRCIASCLWIDNKFYRTSPGGRACTDPGAGEG